MVSAGPPGAKGAMNRMGLFGQPWAWPRSRGHEAQRQAAMKKALRASVLTSSPRRLGRMLASLVPSIPGVFGGTQMAVRKLTREDLHQAAAKYRNWGKWGPEDEIGTLNYVQPEDIVSAARLVKKGKVISLALNFDNNGPQGAKSRYPAMGRINTLHTMLRTGTDAYAGVLDHRGIRAADDVVVMPLQCGPQWDGLGHVFFDDSIWNGYDCREVTSSGAQKCGIEKTKNKMVGRGVFLDVARALGKEVLPDGHAITCADLDLAAKKQKVDVRRGAFVVVRT